jgi:hypothetical protein
MRLNPSRPSEDAVDARIAPLTPWMILYKPLAYELFILTIKMESTQTLLPF